jgi:serine/threonine protein kinase
MTNPSALEAVFFAALEKRAPAERNAYLKEACAGNDELRASVERMLAAQAVAGSFLERPAIAGDATAQFEPSITECAGTVIGPYKLLQQIGEGGMGVVFMAEQTEPIQRTVALKIIKPGMDTRQVVARFEAERQALAMMDHPNIAKVLDAGTTESGRPYFVMELVKGVPITKYCDDKQLPLRARLELMLPVCQAVQHAHQKGLIHRDIKPSNVLVAEYDDRAVPKVIDFGVAKATAQKLTDRTMFTEFGQVIGTFEYMSPEQAKLNQLDIDTRSDIYSLGVLLYELLTGSTPFERKRLQEAAFDEMLRIIREEEPPKPSTRLSTAAGLPNIAASRASEPKKLSGLLKGELDWVVMKALEKDRNRRYETANDLAADVHRYLKNEAVQACPVSAMYRFRKFARRHKLGVAASVAIAVAVLVGVIGTSYGLIWALRERKAAQASAAHAETEAVRSEQVAQFLKDMLKGVAPSKALGRDTAMLREIVDETANRVDKDLKDQPEVQIELLQTLSRVYLDLSLFKKAEETARETLRLAHLHLGEENLAVADSMNQLGRALFFLRQLGESETVARQAISMERKLRGNDSLEEAAAELNLCDVLRRQCMDTDVSKTDRITKLQEAEASLRTCLAIRRKRLGEVHNDVAWGLDALSILIHDTSPDRLDEAEAASRESVAIRQKLYGDDHPDLASSYSYLANALAAKNNLAEAEACYRKALSIERKSKGQDTWWRAMYLYQFASLLQKEGKLDEAESYSREAVAIARKQMGKDNPILGDFTLELAGLLMKKGERVEARELAEETVNIYRRFPDSTVQLSSGLASLADILVRSEDYAAAEPAARECLEIREKNIPDDWRTFNVRNLLGAALLGQQKYADAEPLLLSGYEGLKQREAKISAAGKVHLKETVQRLVKLYEATDQADKAAQWKEKLADIDKTEKPTQDTSPPSR